MLFPRHRRLRLLLVGAALVPAAPAPATAQAGFPLDRFEPAPAGDRMFSVPSPYSSGNFTPHVMLLADYAHDPLVLRRGSAVVAAVVGSQLVLDLDGSFSLWHGFTVDLNLPFAALQQGDSPSIGGVAYTSPPSARLGDLRVGARVPLVGDYLDAFQLAVGGELWAPTGASRSFLSAGTTRAMPQLIVGGRVQDRLVWSAMSGVEFAPSSTYAAVSEGASFRWGAGAGVLLLAGRPLQVGAEATGRLVLRDGASASTTAEILFDARYRVGDCELAAGAGPGLGAGLGAPDVRGVVSVAYTPEPIFDHDHDGVLDRDDACPDAAGPRDADLRVSGCPRP